MQLSTGYDFAAVLLPVLLTKNSGDIYQFDVVLLSKAQHVLVLFCMNWFAFHPL